MYISRIFLLIIILFILEILSTFINIYEKTGYKIIFGIIKKCFFVFLTNIVNASTTIQNFKTSILR